MSWPSLRLAPLVVVSSSLVMDKLGDPLSTGPLLRDLGKAFYELPAEEKPRRALQDCFFSSAEPEYSGFVLPIRAAIAQLALENP